MLTTEQFIQDLTAIVVVVALGLWIYSRITKQSIPDLIKSIKGG